MCQPTSTLEKESITSLMGDSRAPFPWDAGVFDAHCHPTDTMSSIKNIPAMKARGMAIMATRNQDQELVAQVAQSHGIRDVANLADSARVVGQASEPSSTTSSKHVIPAFGWHPWFSYQLHDDCSSGQPGTSSNTGTTALETKKTHYGAVLQPAPSDDQEFLVGLPDPRPLSSLINSMRKSLQEYPAAMIGEIGLDKAFRLPSPAPPPPDMQNQEGLTPGGREGRLLSSYRVKMDHQVAILKAQLALAGELSRPVSIHGVQAHGVLHDALVSTWRGHEKEVTSKRKLKRVAQGAEDWSSSEDDEDDLIWGEDGRPVTKLNKKKEAEAVKRAENLPYPPRICLHSFSGPPQMAKQYLNPAIPAEIYFSFSSCINLASQDQMHKTKSVLDVVPGDKILLESDLHAAGKAMDDALEEVYRFVCAAKGWELRDGVERIGRNFLKFVCG